MDLLVTTPGLIVVLLAILFTIVIVMTLKCAFILVKYIGGLLVATGVALYLYWIGAGIPVLILIGFCARRYLSRGH